MSKVELNQLEARVNSLKEKKIRSEEQLKNLRRQKDEITAELATFGVNPEDLGNVISKLNTEINTKLADINAQIPKDIV